MSSTDYTSKNKISKINDQLNEVKDIMKKNIDDVLERGHNLDELHDKSNDLSVEANLFKRNTVTLKRNMCLKNAKLTFIIICIVLVIIAILAGVIYSQIHINKKP